MSNNVLNVLWNYISFLDKVFNLLEKDNIDVSGYQLDHICYRVETVQRYGELKTIFLKSAELLSETIIWWRMISSFKLEQPLMYKEREIFIIEIPAPKEKNKYSEWLEHVEFVIDNYLQGSFHILEKYQQKKNIIVWFQFDTLVYQVLFFHLYFF